MNIRLKPIADQVIVITGASSGIGLTTARMAARRGAAIVAVARSDDALRQLVQELIGQGHRAVHVAADVASEDDMRHVAHVAVERFGRIDTWINNAGVSIFGRSEEISLEDQRRLFETNFWGVVNGSLAALPYLRARGGALVNLGSEASEAALPLQGIYTASKHAVKGYTDALRVELEAEKAPVSVTLVRPAATDTMLVAHARNYMDVRPRLPAPVYAPEVVADAILFAAEHPKRDLYVGASSRLMKTGAHHAPRLLDKYLARFAIGQQRTRIPVYGTQPGNLHHPAEDLRERGGERRHVMRSSLYTRSAMHSRALNTALMALGVFAAALLYGRRAAR
ncbi:MAG TPA: SDR family oxidoreductase [Casimicrobiaceae bacterium]|jgi:short-subunit dehydrogenase